MYDENFGNLSFVFLVYHYPNSRMYYIQCSCSRFPAILLFPVTVLFFFVFSLDVPRSICFILIFLCIHLLLLLGYPMQ